MAHRSRHGTATSHGVAPVMETLRVSELPKGEPGPARDERPTDRGPGGKFAPGNRISVSGGKAHKDQPRLVERIALRAPPEQADTAPYHRAAVSLSKAARSWLAANVGGGALGPLPSYYAGAGARAAKWANYYSDLAERMEPGSKTQRELVVASLAADEKASSHFRNAHEYAAKEATARRAAAPSPHDALATALATPGETP